eukprot:6386830-Amphidinium_carterae.1
MASGGSHGASMSTVASILIASLLSGREPGQLAASFIFVVAAGLTPMRAAAATGTVKRLIGSILLVGITTLVIAVCTSMRLHQQHQKPQMMDASTQPDQDDTTIIFKINDIIQQQSAGR